MRLSVHHATRYDFAAPVAHALQRLRLTPKTTQGQEIVEWRIGLENAREELRYEDQHRNVVILVSVNEGAGHVTVTCDGVVDTVDHAGVIGRHSGHLPLWSFRKQTPLTTPGEAMRAWLDGAAAELPADPLEKLHLLSAQVRETVAYRVGTTQPDTGAEAAFAGGAGVCQDHAHVFCGLARALGVPARYVSGYLLLDDRVEQDASHAWAEAHVAGLGWVGFDISNGISPDARYVRVATGLDYRDAAPVTGITFGTSTQTLDVRIAVAQTQSQASAQQ